MMPSLTPSVLQLHPSRACNLRCLHCYSSSAPDERYEQDVSLLAGAINDAAELGYRVVSISGGEPLLYSELPSLLSETRRRGMQVTITTNGMLLDGPHLKMLTGKVDLLAISLDGVPKRHNYMRNAPRAFETMRRRLDGLRCSGIPFGFLFTLTHENVDDLTWVAEFAASEGARLLQVHPLEETGRARTALQGQAPTDVDTAVAWLLVGRLSERYISRLKIHLDLLNRDILRSVVSQLDVRKIATCSGMKASRLADFVSPLVVESDGTVVPLQYGFPRTYALGNLNDASMIEMSDVWFAEALSNWQALCARATDSLCQPAELPFVNWYESMVAVARESHSEPFAILR
jgi:MoaA/NifB/PqqE/SkfB family radical SAM enzyme